jgi:hypothetical protein
MSVAAEAVDNDPSRAADLNRVTFKKAPAGDAVVLVREGVTNAVIVLLDATNSVAQLAAQELKTHIKLATGADLAIVTSVPPAGVSLVLADEAYAGRNGVKVADLPAEGFEIKTVPGGVMIAGQNVLWGAYEFLERFAGIRWYFPGDLGCSAPALKTLAVQPVWLADAPVVRNRTNWPENFAGVTEQDRRLRQGSSWPNRIACHTPTEWGKYYGQEHPEYFQLRNDGQRNLGMLCYSHPATLDRYLTTIEEYYAGKYVDAKGNKAPGPWGWFQPDEHVISVSPNDAPVTCYCDLCRAKWNEQGGSLGEASSIVADFVARLAVQAAKRWPDKTVTYLAYANYTVPPAGVTFPGNVEVHVCGMRALANYKEPEIAKSEQAIIDGWHKISGRPLQIWHYICWPDDSTTAPYLFPHVIRTFYQVNRNQVAGTFINGSGNHWPRHQVSLYAWLKCMWNPDFDIDAAIDEECRRLFGPAAKIMRALFQVQIDGWEKSHWTVLPAGHNVSPKNIHEESYPPERVAEMKALLARARAEAAGDALVLKRIDYFAPALETFFLESQEYHAGAGRTVLRAIKAGEDPVVDGKLDDKVWERAEPVSFIKAMDKADPKAQYPTVLRAVWTERGITFGFRMQEPEPARMSIRMKGHDDAQLWFDDNVEAFLDPAGQRSGYFQWIMTPLATVYDGSFEKGADWNPEGVKVAAFIGPDYWSCELFIPYEVFRKEGIQIDPAALSGKAWFGNFTRHRTAQPTELQRLNTTFEDSNLNMMAFGPIKFVE